MEIYVQSRGSSQDFDYRWQGETPNLAAPNILRESNVYNLIQGESPSIVLGRHSEKLFLLVTGLKSKERRDFRGRVIRNSVLWICEESEENEQSLRALTVNILRDILQNDIDKAITFSENENEFKTDFDAIRKLGVEVGKVEKFPVKSERKIGNNNQALREDLAFELEERCLPKFENQLLIVVTGIKPEATLKEFGVWRGLSNLVKGEDWEDYNFPVDPGEDSPTDNNLILLIGFISLLVIISFTLFWLKPNILLWLKPKS
ncbi:hypothetical protein [Brunnivagina elsteri]|uniref:hypothetical protein n=1 Tax=Brunnivagina elsteri TaxID=1247191 RepID=UPI001B808F87|nr:hypothetical protein [Calothrix elsteri]